MTKIKLSIKNRFTGSIIFEYEKENNTIKETVLEAIKSSADLRSANLSSADLRYANLSSANLSSANLSYADLRSANLRSADLSYANLSSADLSYANLSYANLSYANLRYAEIISANLSTEKLSNGKRANLSYANLSYANLSYANLSYANLSYANLSYANLSYAINAELAIAQTRVCSEGDIIGWKKCQNNIIVKLLIPKDAKRNNAFGRKCRAEFADVLEIFGAEKAVSQNDNEFIYEVGKRVTPKNPFDENFIDECSTGIHFFITRLEAEKY